VTPAAQVEKLLSGQLAARSALLKFYSRERLESAASRLDWAEPDLAPLALDAVFAPRA
jgi:hypothetical protein